MSMLFIPFSFFLFLQKTCSQVYMSVSRLGYHCRSGRTNPQELVMPTLGPLAPSAIIDCQRLHFTAPEKISCPGRSQRGVGHSNFGRGNSDSSSTFMLWTGSEHLSIVSLHFPRCENIHLPYVFSWKSDINCNPLS